MPTDPKPTSVDEAFVALGRGLEWALYWIGRRAEVPLPEEGDGEWERWEGASRALRTFGPESGYGREAYRLEYLQRLRERYGDDEPEGQPIAP